MKIQQVSPTDIPQVASQLKRTIEPDTSCMARVQDILTQVRLQGDKAIRAFTLAYDGVDLQSFRVTTEEVLQAYDQVPSDYIDILKRSRANIQQFHLRQKTSSWSFSPQEGVITGQLVRPLSAVGVYIPGGRATYPSSVLMNVIPAQIAGVDRIVLFTPPSRDGTISPSVLVAADQLGIKEIYKIGGAQAVAAAAYGTETIPAVDKITGPGNQYVATAKQLVFGTIDIDMIAGPSEILVLADDQANSRFIAADLLAQGEHDPQAAMILVTPSSALIGQVALEVEKQKEKLQRKSILEESCTNHLWALEVADMQVGIDLTNALAPEHLEIMTHTPERVLDQIQHAGSIFLGPWTPEALGDYYAGPNHTLPTAGTARFSSPLGVYDFIKRPTYITYSEEALSKVSRDVQQFALLEGLDGHAQAIEVRLDSSTNTVD